MLRIRLQRVGRKHETAFRIVAVDSRRGARSGRALEVLGSYDPRRGKPILKADKIKRWMALGAQVSGTVHNLLVDAKILTGAKVNVLPKRKPKKVEDPIKTSKPTEEVVTPEAEVVAPVEAESVPSL